MRAYGLDSPPSFPKKYTGVTTSKLYEAFVRASGYADSPPVTARAWGPALF